jgi:tetratricopeptide (TPR) repeat protein
MVMLALQSPLEAYRADLARHPGRRDFGSSDTLWLLVTHCLSRLSRTDELARNAIAEYCVTAIAELVSDIDPKAEETRTTVAAVAKLRYGLGDIEGREGADCVSQAVREMADAMGDAGALSLAYCSLGHLRAALPAASPREQGLMLADQARVARLIGDLEGAEELYEMASEIGRRFGKADVEVRATLGRGVIARVRGNYPKARSLFETGLRKATAAGLDELAAAGHQGLLIAAAAAGDVDTALVHGWAAYELAATDASRQAEMLFNLGHLCLLAGYPTAALRGFLASMRRARGMRSRLPALGSAAEAAARLGDAALVSRIATLVTEAASHASLPYETSQAFRSLSVACGVLGNATEAESWRLRARELAKRGGFFEVVHATERQATPMADAPPRRELTQPSRLVVASMESLDEEHASELLELTHAG